MLGNWDEDDDGDALANPQRHLCTYHWELQALLVE